MITTANPLDRTTQLMEFPENSEHATAASLEAAIEQCCCDAERGYNIVRNILLATNKAISSYINTLNAHMEDITDAYDPSVAQQLRGQINDMMELIIQLRRTLRKTLKERRAQAENFRIVLLGRTMSGKSTTLEIMTNGDGSSIGKGAQRTTRDVRIYEWKGLAIIDVPGVAAVGGTHDEQIAIEAGSQADLILFLITDDAPQPVEAECLAKICRLGKPVIGICNIKLAVDSEDDLRLFLRNAPRIFDSTRIRKIIDQFHAFLHKYHTEIRVPFIVTHLRARFLANLPAYATYKDHLLAASRFGDIEARIMREVIERGPFLRLKNFVDAATVPIMTTSEKLLENSEMNFRNSRIAISKVRKLHEWRDNFCRKGEQAIQTFIIKFTEKLRDAVPSFAENHYEDRHAGKKWEKLVASFDVNLACKNIQEELYHECRYALSEFGREIKCEISLMEELTADRRIQMEPITDIRALAVIISGLTAIISIFHPIGKILHSITSFIFSLFDFNPEAQIKRAKRKLAKMLYADIDKRETALRQQLMTWFHRELLSNTVDVFCNSINLIAEQWQKLAEMQSTFAWHLNDHHKALARLLLGEALNRIGAADLESSISDIARAPGGVTMLLTNTIFPKKVRDGLTRLFGEKIRFVANAQNLFSVLAEVIGRDCDRTKITIDSDSRIAYVPIEAQEPLDKTRVRLAQQLTSLYIMRSA